SSPRVFLGDEGVGALEGRLVGEGDGSLALRARCRSPRADLALSGRVALAAPYAADLTVEAGPTSLDPFVRAAAIYLPSAVGIVASGALAVRGPLRTPRALAAEAEVKDLLVSLPDYPVRNTAPLHLRLADGVVQVQRLELSGEGTDLAVAGTAAVLADGG